MIRTGVFILFACISWPLIGQVSDSTSVDRDSTLIPTPPDSLLLRPQFEKDSAKVEVISPWQNRLPTAFVKVSNDSLLRWQVWPDWGHFQAYRNNTISFRQGTLGRLDAFEIGGYFPEEQRLSVNGASLNSVITGLPQYGLVPHHKNETVSEEYSGTLSQDIRLRDYYINEPVSYMNYDESGQLFRNLEFLVTRNFSSRTNLELSYWDRRDGGQYQRNDVQGAQLFAKAYHYLNQNLVLKSTILTNQFDNEEPFGYIVADPNTFSFDPFTTSPNSFAGTTETSRRDFITGIYTRADSTSPEQAGVEVLLNRDEFTRSWTADTLNWDVRTNGLKAFKWWDFGPLALKTDASFMYHRRVSGSTISKSNWSLSSATTRLEYKPGTNRLVYAEALGTYRSDDGAGYDLAFGFQEKRSRLHLQGSGSLFSRIATIQEMYWASGSLTGNSNLDNETGFSLQGSMTYRVGSSTTVGLEGRYRYSDNQAFITPDSTFINGSGFGTSTTTAFVQFNSKRWELETSLVYGASQFPDSLTQTDALNIPGDRLWIRNSVFVKGYVFKRATYIKTGIRTLISPLSYSTRWYDTNTHYWQANSTQQPIPSFIRVDAELSARIRSIMIVTRWENILDGVGQAGYFETATFPMMPRRFIVGIRARFIN